MAGPVPVAVAEPGVAVTPVRVALVCIPPIPVAESNEDASVPRPRGPVWHLATTRRWCQRRGRTARIGRLIDLERQRPTQLHRKAIKKHKLFPSDDSVRKVVYLAVMDTSKKWTMPIRNWKGALNRFIIEFEDRLIDYV